FGLNFGMSSNRTQLPTELDENLEHFVTISFFSVGCLSSVLSAITVYLLAKKSSFLTKDIRILLLNVQVQAFLNNFHFCILFAPIIYPFVGGGFCTGLLCVAGVKFHYGFVI
ncbi:hypothetical protein PFISCL1PPCAC_13594, partial [Pristionchus fissidentatus]